MKLRPHQELAAHFLMADRHRLLADEPRVGKTASALQAVKALKLRRVLVVCPVSVMYVWAMEAKRWGVPLTIGVCDIRAEFCIVPWSRIATGELAALIRQCDWDVIIADESHYAKSMTAQRTKAFYGTFRGRQIDTHAALVRRSDRVWCLTGTPIPHDPSDLYPMMRTLFSQTLAEGAGLTDVTAYSDFEARYVTTRPQKISPWKSITVKTGGKNESELAFRLGKNMLRRRQMDIGIRPADHDLLPLKITPTQRRQIETELEVNTVLGAIERRDYGALKELVTPRILHLTGDIKAHVVADAAKDYFEDTGEKLVIAYWHQSVGEKLMDGLAKYHPLRVDGSTLAPVRAAAIERFRDEPMHRVFLAQIAAAGEGIDLSVAPELWFAESVFSPRMMAQCANRIINMNSHRQALVRVCTLTGSIDEKIAEVLLRLYTTIEKVLED